MPHVDGRASPNAHLLVGELPVQRQLAGRWREGTGLSIAAHTIVLVVFLFLYAGARAPQVLATVTPMMGWKPELHGRPGLGGAGDETSTPARRLEVVDTHPRHIEAAANPADAITPPINVPVVTAQAVQTLPGALTELDATSLGRGAGPGGVGGEGAGSGPHRGKGAGDGGPDGTGGVFEPGSGVTTPQLIFEVKPGYTVDAMRAKLQGVVELEALVLPDGSVDPRRIRITRSLDRALGLDEQAIAAVRQWRFRPGTLKGRPVPVRVLIELTFTLR
jgi:protein TonB